MSEPVGNGPRAPIPGNSHRAREEQATPPAQVQERAPVEKVISGKVITRKSPWYRRAAGRMFAEDMDNVGEYVFFNIALPGFRNLVRNMFVGALDRALYGGDFRPQGVPGVVRGNIVGTGAGPISSIRDKYNTDYQSAQNPGQPRRMMSREAQARHDFDDIVLETREEVVTVIESLIQRIEAYGMASVADMYDMLGTTGSFADRGYGWKNLADANVRQIPEGWLLDLPKPIPLR